MADVTGEYLVSPETGNTVLVPTENAEAAKADGFLPASDKQIQRFKADVETARSPITSGLRSVVEQAAEFAAPTGLLRGAAVAGAAQAEEQANIQKTMRESLAQATGRAPVAAGPSERAFATTGAGLRKAAEVIEPFTPLGLMTKTNLTTPEEFEARREAFGRVPEAVPLIGGAPVTSVLAMPVAMKAPSVLGKIPGGKTIPSGVGKILGSLDDASALTLADKLVRSPIAQATETSALDLLESTPYLSKASPVVKNIVAKAVANGAGSSAELALLSLGQISQEDILGDHKLTAERAAAAMKEGALGGFELGFLTGGTGAATSAGLRGAARVAGDATRAARDKLLAWYPKASEYFTGLPADITENLARRRADLTRQNAGDLVAEAVAAKQEPLVPPEPFVPGIKPARPEDIARPGVITEEGIRPATLTSPIVKAPELPPIEPGVAPEKPIPGTPFPPAEPPALKPVDIDAAAIDLSNQLKATLKHENDLLRRFNAEIRPAEEAPQIDAYRRAREYAAPSLFQKKLIRVITPKDQGLFKQFVQGIEDEPRMEAQRLADYARGVVEATKANEPHAVPLGVLRQIESIAESLESASSAEGLSASKIKNNIDVAKRRIFEIKDTLSKDVRLRDETQAALRAINAAGGEMLRSGQNAEMWGPSAARNATINQARTAITTARTNLLNSLGTGEQIDLRYRGKIIDEAKLKKTLETLGSAESARKIRHTVEYLQAADNMIKQIDESIRATQHEANSAEAVNSLGRTLDSYANAQEQIIRRADNEAALEAFKASERERVAFNKQLSAENKARQAEYQQMRDQFDAQEAERQKARTQLQAKMSGLEQARAAQVEEQIRQIDAANEVAKEQYKQRLEQWNEREAARRAEAKAKQDEFDAKVKEQKNEVKKYVDLLKHGAKSNALTDVIIGAELLSHPVLGSVFAAIKTGSRMMRDPVATYKTLHYLERAAKATENATKAVADGIVTGTPVAIKALTPMAAARTMKQEHDEFETRSKQVNKLATDLSEFNAHMDRNVNALDETAPKVAGHARDVTAAAIQHLAADIPKPPPNTPPFQRATWKPTDAQVRQWNRKADAIMQPATVMARMADGSATQDEINTINAVYGNLMKDLQQKILDRLKENPDMPAPRRMMLNKILSLDTDGSAQLGLTAQSIYGSQAPAEQPQLKSYQGKALNMANRAEYAGPARREAQPTGIEQRIQARR